jgi:tagatose 1,6-diphosphate aldolase
MDAPFNPGELADGDLRLELIGFAHHRIHRVPTYYFRMIHTTTRQELGSVNLRTVTTPHVERYAGHVGYSVNEEHRGKRYAARSVRLILPLAQRLGLNPLWFTCDPENAASRRTMELAGARFIEIVTIPEDSAIFMYDSRPKCRYRLDLIAPG